MPSAQTYSSHVRVTISLRREDAYALSHLGKGRPTHAVEHLLHAFLAANPDAVPATPPARFVPPPTMSLAERKARDAAIYYECIARTFTRAEIAQRYGLSKPRVDQIFAALRRNPPGYHLILDAPSHPVRYPHKPDPASAVHELLFDLPDADEA